jgi:hypothetical protein
MKWLWVCLLVFVMPGCKKTNSFTTTGRFVGPDPLFCGCCGGIVLETSTGQVYRVEALYNAQGQNILPQLSWPQNIRFNWKPGKTCTDVVVYIEITDYALF